MSRRRQLDLRPQVDLGRDDRLMTWSSNLNIYRVNRFNVFDLNETKKAAKAEIKFDLIEAWQEFCILRRDRRQLDLEGQAGEQLLTGDAP